MSNVNTEEIRSSPSADIQKLQQQEQLLQRQQRQQQQEQLLQRQQQQQQQERRIVTVTICPPGCENGICQRVFEDSLGLGYQIRCLCKKCHGNDGDKL
jgi:phosphoribosyl-dephospho-CoA transferase